MKLLTKEIEARLPALDDEKISTTPLKDMVAQVKYFDPAGSWTWFGIAYDPKTKIMFGYVKGFENEFGDFSLTELEEYKGRFGLGIERDLFFEPTVLSELM